MIDCNKCIFATRDGGCASWECKFVDKEEAYKAWKVAKEHPTAIEIHNKLTCSDSFRE